MLHYSVWIVGLFFSWFGCQRCELVLNCKEEKTSCLRCVLYNTLWYKFCYTCNLKCFEIPIFNMCFIGNHGVVIIRTRNSQNSCWFSCFLVVLFVSLTAEERRTDRLHGKVPERLGIRRAVTAVVNADLIADVRGPPTREGPPNKWRGKASGGVRQPNRLIRVRRSEEEWSWYPSHQWEGCPCPKNGVLLGVARSCAGSTLAVPPKRN